MATTERSWSSNLNVLISDGATPDQKTQYREAFLQLHLWIKAAGWNTTFSSDGHTTAGAGDNIGTSLANVIIGNEGTENHSWAAYTPPTNWTNGTIMGMCINIDELVANASPRIMRKISAALGVFTGGDLQNRATAPNEYPDHTYNLLHNTGGPVNMHAHMGRAGEGDWWFGLSEDGTTKVETLLGMGTPDYSLAVEDGGPDHPDHAWFTFYCEPFSVEGAKLLVGSAGAAADNVNMPSSIGSWPANRQRAFLQSAAIDYPQWVDGASSASGKPITTSIDGMINEAALGRFLGKWPDIEVVPLKLAPGIIEDGDTDLVRFVTLGNLWVPVLASQLPLIV